MPGTIAYQGFLTFDGGAPFEGQVEIQVALHSSSTAATLVQGVAWGPALFPAVQVDGGIFDLVMGGMVGPALDASVLEAQPLWLAIWINGTLMQPLQAMHAVPYALIAGRAAALGDKPASAYTTQAQVQTLQSLIAQQQLAIEDLQALVALNTACCEAMLPPGACSPASLDGTGCDNGNVCTANDICVGGQCVGSPVNCDNNNPCTDDVCVPASGCLSLNNSSPCNDGNACTVADTCDAGTCVGTPLPCNDGLSCTTDSCEAGNCVHTLVAGFCSIGGVCYLEGTANPSNNCESCVPNTSPRSWTNSGPCGSVSLTWTGGIGFDVSDDGSMTAAGYTSTSGGQVTAACSGPSGSLTGTLSLGSYPSNTRVYVARADVIKHSVVTVFPWPNNNPTSLYTYFISTTCTLSAGPIALPGLSQELTGGSLEYFDGYRNVHARIQPLQTGGYLIPGPYQYTEGFRWFGVYTKDGVQLASKPIGEALPLIRASANNDIFVLKSTSIHVNSPPFTLYEFDALQPQDALGRLLPGPLPKTAAQ